MRFVAKPKTKQQLAAHMIRSHHSDPHYFPDITKPHLEDIHEDALHGDQPDAQTHTHQRRRR